MLYREYGSTGVQVSALGFGGMRFDDQGNREECAALVKAAHDAGVNYFDTAPGYGDSEELFGLAFQEMLKNRREHPFYVSTKSMALNSGNVRRDMENSLERMGLDYIDFYHVWYIHHMDEFERRRAMGVLEEFEKLKSEGLARHIVVSTHLPGEQVGNLLRAYPFEGVLLGYSAMNFAYREAGLEVASERGLGVAVMNPLAGGIIPQHPELFSFLRSREDETVVEAALRFLFNNERIDVVLVGLGNQKELREAVSAVDGYRPLNKGRVDEMRKNLNVGLNKLCTNCGYCDNCPEGIPIPQFMDSWNYFHLTGKVSQLQTRIALHWHIEEPAELLGRCSECGRCEDACTQDLPIIARLKEMRELLRVD